MVEKNPFEVIKHRWITEKSMMLQNLQDNESNPSIKRFKLPKYVFIVDARANKREIAKAVEEIYSEKKIKVTAVNVINAKPKPKQMRRRQGKTATFKKAIVTLEEGDSIEES